MAEKWLIFTANGQLGSAMSTEEVRLWVLQGKVPIDAHIARENDPEHKMSVLDVDEIFETSTAKEPSAETDRHPLSSQETVVRPQPGSLTPP
ncbi:MAG: hypothetical protein OXT67_01515, partial [Zetaproteobacteria bacterium]|nr:hypothetical protein [Zetaproteobacteria bacterium]